MPYKESFEGHVDLVDDTRIHGWAWDSEDPDANIKIDIYDSEKLIGTVTADVFRQDLREAGKGKGYHGYIYDIPLQIKNGEKHTFHVKFSGTETELYGSPKTIRLNKEKGIFKNRLKAIFKF